MKKTFGESELILRPDGSVYHLGVTGSEIADKVIIVGDPERVEQISSRFDRIDVKKASREFCIHTGKLNGTDLTVISTGIGVDNIDIVINELDAAANINPTTRKENDTLRRLEFVRLGTSGALSPDINLHDVVCSKAAIGMDGVPHFYDFEFSAAEKKLASAFKKECEWPDTLAFPYAVYASGHLVEKMKETVDHFGITVTANGFYGPQNRELRIPIRRNFYDTFQNFQHGGLRITNFEMETAGIYALSEMLGHSHVTLCVILANRVRKEFSKDPSVAVNLLIDKALNSITN